MLSNDEGKKELKTPQQIQLEKKQREKNKLKQKLGRYRWIRENLGDLAKKTPMITQSG